MNLLWSYFKNPELLFGQVVPQGMKKYRPVVVTLVCIVGFILSWSVLRQSAPTVMMTLPVVAVFDEYEVLDRTTALNELTQLKNQGKHQQAVSAQLFEGNVWVLFEVPRGLGFSHVIFNGNYLRQENCSFAQDRFQTLDVIKKIGPYRLTTLNTETDHGLWLCNMQFYGPSIMSVELHYHERYERWVDEFNRKNFFVQGALLILAFMTLLLSFLLSSKKLVSLFFWVVMALHFLAIVEGWEEQLVTHMIWNMDLSVWRLVNMALFMIATAFLLRQLSRPKPGSLMSNVMVVVVILTALMALVSILSASYMHFLLWFWPILAAMVAMLLISLVNNLFCPQSGKHLYITIALSILLAGMLMELSLSWSDPRVVQNAVGGRSVSLFGTILLILAVSESLNNNRLTKMQLADRLRSANRELEVLFQLMPQPAFVLGEDGVLSRSNRGFEMLSNDVQRTFNCSPLAALQSVVAVDPAEDHKNNEHDATHSAALDQHASRRIEHTLKNSAGVVQHLELVLARLPHGQVGVMRDITAEKTRELAQFYQIIHDDESGAMNKLGLEHLLSSRHEAGGQNCLIVKMIVQRWAEKVADVPLSVSGKVLKSMTSHLIKSLKFQADVIYMRHGVFCFLVKPGREDQTVAMLQEAKFWQAMRLPLDFNKRLSIQVHSQVLDLNQGVVVAMQQVDRFGQAVWLADFNI